MIFESCRATNERSATTVDMFEKAPSKNRKFFFVLQNYLLEIIVLRSICIPTHEWSSTLFLTTQAVSSLARSNGF